MEFSTAQNLDGRHGPNSCSIKPMTKCIISIHIVEFENICQLDSRTKKIQMKTKSTMDSK